MRKLAYASRHDLPDYLENDEVSGGDDDGDDSGDGNGDDNEDSDEGEASSFLNVRQFGVKPLRIILLDRKEPSETKYDEAAKKIVQYLDPNLNKTEGNTGLDASLDMVKSNAQDLQVGLC